MGEMAEMMLLAGMDVDAMEEDAMFVDSCVGRKRRNKRDREPYGDYCDDYDDYD